MPRRTQAERRAESMRRLEEAAIEALVDRGAAGATTAAICERAGLSQGALFQHYPTKDALLVAAVRRLYAERRRVFDAALEGVGEGERVRRALGLLWRAFANPEVVATLELYASSRTNPALRGELSPMLEAHWQGMIAAAAQVLPAAAVARPDFPSILAITVAAVQGAAMGAVVEGTEPPGLDRHLDFLAGLFAGEGGGTR